MEPYENSDDRLHRLLILAMKLKRALEVDIVDLSSSGEVASNSVETNRRN